MKKFLLLSIVLVATLGVATNVRAQSMSNIQSAVGTVPEEDGFVDVKLENLNEKVQVSVKALQTDYELKALKYNADKGITKVEATKKSDQSLKVFYFDAEGKEFKMEKNATKKVQEAVEKVMETPSPEAQLYTKQKDGFVDIKFEELNQKVQEAVRTISEKYELKLLQYSAEKKITKVQATAKEDKSEKVFYLDEEGKEVKLDAAAQEKKSETVEEGMKEVPLY